MCTYRIFAHDGWFAIAVRSGAYERVMPTMYQTKEAAQRVLLGLLGH
jgi:hypothetical protein